MARRSLNLTVRETSVQRAQRYSEMHGISISRLVDDFLAQLPVSAEPEELLTPDVQRLLGIGAGPADRETYRKRLLEKHDR